MALGYDGKLYILAFDHRGSFQKKMFGIEGDPTPEETERISDAKRLKIEDATTITKIPVLPISYGDAQPLLEALGGPVAPEDWRGALPITYHVGPGPAKVHFVAKFNWDMKPLYDVIGKIRGSEFPDEWVIRGNHHDGWVNGAEDPISGQSPMLEEVRSFGMLLKAGWKPKRTIIYCAWDGEEEGLMGATEWVETHAAELEKSGVMYVNSDTNEPGFLDIGGSHTLEQLSNDVARAVTDPVPMTACTALLSRPFTQPSVQRLRRTTRASSRSRLLQRAT